MGQCCLPRLHPLVWGASILTLGAAGSYFWFISSTESVPAAALASAHKSGERSKQTYPKASALPSANPKSAPSNLTDLGIISGFHGVKSAPPTVAAASWPAPPASELQPMLGRVETIDPMPQFRPVRGQSTINQDLDPQDAPPIALDFRQDATFPAILAAPSTTTAATGAKQAEMENQILKNFIAAVQAPGSTEVATDQNAVSGVEPRLADEKWTAASQAADDQTRLLLGHDAFMRKSLEAAILKRQQSLPSE